MSPILVVPFLCAIIHLRLFTCPLPDGTAVPAYLRHAHAKIPEQLNYLRRVYVEEFSGCGTIFFGPCPANGYDCSDFVKHQLYRLKECREVCYCGTSEAGSRWTPALRMGNNSRAPTGDNTVSILHFEREDGRAIGSICRFAAHAVCSNRPEYFSSDYPFLYVVPVEEYAKGGYETACCLVSPAAESMLSQEALALLARTP